MQLRNARLCLDCEEVHESQQCPSCASESFVFITRWVPAPSVDRSRAPVSRRSRRETVDTYREMLNPGPGFRRLAVRQAVAPWDWRSSVLPV